MWRLLRTTAFRVALLYFWLFLVSVIVIFSVFYSLTAGFIERELNDSIANDIISLREQFDNQGVVGLIEMVRARSANRHSNSFYLLAAPSGAILAGNLSVWPNAKPDAHGKLHFRVSEVGGLAGRPATAQAAVLVLSGSLYLLVGRDMSEIDLLRSRIIKSLWWIAAVVASLGIGGGLLLSRGILRRVEAINLTTRRIMAGDLSGRVPHSGSGDEIDRLAGNLNAMLVQIERLMTGMRQVTENIAHDLRTPLSRMRTRIELTLLQHEEEPEQHRIALQETLVEVDRLLATFKALLSIAEAASEARRSDFRMVDLAETVRHIADLYEPVADEAGLSFIATIRSTPMVRGDSQLLSQAVANLLENAIKYTPAGGRIVLTVGGPTVEGAGADWAACLSVADTGPGIPAEMREAVLQRFVRLDSARASPGNGLGLSLVDAVAHLHGASLRLEDNGPGLRVRLLLPSVSTA